MERRSISIEPELHSRILKFRAFFMSHGIDVDYTAAINFLALHGYDELMKSGFNATLLERFGSRAALDRTTREAISSDWLEGKMRGLSASDKGLGARDSQGKVARTVQSPQPSQAQLKAAKAFCLKCKVSRQMRDPHVVTLKNGKQAVQGTCPVCRSKMFHLGIPH